jgi:hypothetical protein
MQLVGRLKLHGWSGSPRLVRPDHAATPSMAAILTRSGSERAIILRISLPRCTFTVISLMPSSAVTCLFKRHDERHYLGLTACEGRIAIAQRHHLGLATKLYAADLERALD